MMLIRKIYRTDEITKKILVHSISWFFKFLSNIYIKIGQA